MNTQKEQPCYRILVIDDNTAIHEDFRKILDRVSETEQELKDLESFLFDAETDQAQQSDVQFERVQFNNLDFLKNREMASIFILI